VYSRSYNSGSYNSYLEITYFGGFDSDVPVFGFVPYTGLALYVEGVCTFFTTLTDMFGIDITTANVPTLNYALNNGLYTSVSVISIGICSLISSQCNFKVVIPAIFAGDYVEYYWKYQDLNVVNGVNVGYDLVLIGF
jgi:hypothetical protein